MQTVDRIVAVLREASWAQEGLSLSELCRRTGLPPATCHRIVGSLGDAGLLRRDPGTRRWRAGQGLAQIAGGIRPTAGSSLEIEEHLVGLRERWPEAWHLAILSDGAVTCVHALEPPHDSRQPRRQLGDALPLHCSAPARAILARLGPGEARRLLESVERPALTPRTLTGLDELAAELETTRQRRWAMSEHEIAPRVTEIAVAIDGPPGEPSRSIGVIGPSMRMRRHLRLGLARDLVAVASGLRWEARRLEPVLAV